MCVFDPRVAKPVVTINTSVSVDCWSVAFGGNVSASDRSLASGYDNGDVSLFDLRAGKQLWKKNVGKGVCCVAFDTKTKPVDKIYATTLEAKINILSIYTFHQNPFQAFKTNLSSKQRQSKAAPSVLSKRRMAQPFGSLHRYRKARLYSQRVVEMGR